MTCMPPAVETPGSSQPGRGRIFSTGGENDCFCLDRIDLPRETTFEDNEAVAVETKEGRGDAMVDEWRVHAPHEGFETPTCYRGDGDGFRSPHRLTMNCPACSRALLDERDCNSGARQFPGCCEAGWAGSNDDNFSVRHVRLPHPEPQDPRGLA